MSFVAYDPNEARLGTDDEFVQVVGADDETYALDRSGKLWYLWTTARQHPFKWRRVPVAPNYGGVTQIYMHAEIDSWDRPQWALRALANGRLFQLRIAATEWCWDALPVERED